MCESRTEKDLEIVIILRQWITIYGGRKLGIPACGMRHGIQNRLHTKAGVWTGLQAMLGWVGGSEQLL
jgi:hypothetical protein